MSMHFNRKVSNVLVVFVFHIDVCGGKVPPRAVEPMMMMMMMISMYNYNSGLYKFPGSTFQKILKL